MLVMCSKGMGWGGGGGGGRGGRRGRAESRSWVELEGEERRRAMGWGGRELSGGLEEWRLEDWRIDCSKD